MPTREEMALFAKNPVARSTSKIQLAPYMPPAGTTAYVPIQRKRPASPHLASNIDIRDVSDKGLRAELRAEQPSPNEIIARAKAVQQQAPMACKMAPSAAPARKEADGRTTDGEAQLLGREAYVRRGAAPPRPPEPGHRPGHPDKAIRTPLFLIPEPSRTGEVYITQTARRELSDKERSKAERVHRELEQLRKDMKVVDEELDKIGPHDPKHPMKTNWASGGVLHGTSSTVGKVLAGASASTLELINSYANSYVASTAGEGAAVKGVGGANDAAFVPSVSPFTGAISVGRHAPELQSGLAPEHRFTQRGIHGGSTADFQASFLSAATPKVRPMLRPRTGGYARTPVGLAYEPPATLLSNPTGHKQYPPHMAHLLQPANAVAQLRPPTTEHQLLQQKQQEMIQQQQAEAARELPPRQEVQPSSPSSHQEQQYIAQLELERQFDQQWRELERAETRTAGGPTDSKRTAGGPPAAGVMPRSRSAAVVGVGLHMPRSPLGLQGQHAVSMHSIRNRLSAKQGFDRPALTRPGSSAAMLLSTPAGRASLRTSPSRRVVSRASKYAAAHAQRSSQQRYPRSPSAFELAQHDQDVDELHNVLDLPHVADLHGAQFAPMGEAKISDWWFYSPEEAKASHPILRVSSEKSIAPRREWDQSCVEVLPGDLEDEDTPRGRGSEAEPEVRVWRW